MIFFLCLSVKICVLNYNIMHLLKFFSLFIVSVFLFSLPSCNQGKMRIHKKSKILMDTVVTITVVSDSESKADESINAAFKELERLDHLLNFFSKESEISRINSLAGIKPARVSKDTYELVKKAIEIAETSDGAYDPTIGPVMTLWDFHKKMKPSDEDIQKRLPLINYKNVILNKADSSIMLAVKGMLLDPGGIAKGFAADRAVEVLKNNGITAGIVAIAGDIKVIGSKPDRTRWKVGIRAPRGDRNDLSAVLRLKDMAVSTSGDYERFFIKDGIRYHHLLDPKTGYPVRDFQSISIVSKEGILSDAMSTAIFILRKEKGEALIKKLSLKAFIVYENGKISISDNLRGLIEAKGNHFLGVFVRSVVKMLSVLLWPIGVVLASCNKERRWGHDFLSNTFLRSV